MSGVLSDGDGFDDDLGADRKSALSALALSMFCQIKHIPAGGTFSNSVSGKFPLGAAIFSVMQDLAEVVVVRAPR